MTNNTQTDPPAFLTMVRPGVFDRRTLDQGFYWLPRCDNVDAIARASEPGQRSNRRRHPLLLAQMTEDHLVNVLAWLHERARLLHFEAMVDVVAAALDGGAAEEVLAHQVGASVVDVDADAWLEATALVRAIRRELHLRHRSNGGPR